jgi:hypothetical protein
MQNPSQRAFPTLDAICTLNVCVFRTHVLRCDLSRAGVMAAGLRAVEARLQILSSIRNVLI